MVMSLWYRIIWNVSLVEIADLKCLVNNEEVRRRLSRESSYLYQLPTSVICHSGRVVRAMGMEPSDQGSNPDGMQMFYFHIGSLFYLT